jgi:hypothetical protein
MISEKAKEIIHKLDTEREYNSKKEKERDNEIEVIKDYGICPRCGENIKETRRSKTIQIFGMLPLMGLPFNFFNNTYICKRCKLKFKF